MVTLLIIGVCLWLAGWMKTLAVYVGIIASTCSLILTMVVGLGFSYLFFHTSVQGFESGEWWTSMFVSREGFELWEAFFVPIIFFFDMVRMSFKFCWQVPNIFSIGVFAYWWYLMSILWINLILPIIRAVPKTARSNSTGVVVR